MLIETRLCFLQKAAKPDDAAAAQAFTAMKNSLMNPTLESPNDVGQMVSAACCHLRRCALAGRGWLNTNCRNTLAIKAEVH